MARTRNVGERLLRVIDEERIGGRQQRDGCSLFIFACVPDDGSSGFHTHILGHGVCDTVQAAGCNNVDGSWLHDK